MATGQVEQKHTSTCIHVVTGKVVNIILIIQNIDIARNVHTTHTGMCGVQTNAIFIVTPNEACIKPVLMI